MALHDLAGITRMAAELPAELQRAQRRGVSGAALHVTQGIRGEIKAVTGDGRLSGVGRRGAKVGARYDVKGTLNPTALITATGPLHLIERGTSPHVIRPRRRRGRGKRRVLAMADGRFAATARHPGTSGKAPFARGVTRTRGDTGAIFDREIQAAIRRVLR